MGKNNIKNLAELIYNPEEDFLLSKQAAMGIAERFYKELGDRAEKFTLFYKSNKEKVYKLAEKYMNLNSFSKLFNSLTDEKAMQGLIYKNLLMMENDLRKNSYDLKNTYREIEKKIEKDYTNF